MAAGERMKISSNIVWSRRRFPLLLVTAVTACLLLPVSVTAQVDCYYCEQACDIVTPELTVQCEDECGAWYLSAGDTLEVFRGCVEDAEVGTIVYERCQEDLCNDANPVQCLRCESVDYNECEDVICPTATDQCYLKPEDGHRGCTSDAAYETDCSPETDERCSLCTSQSGRSCNGNIQCVVCDTTVDPTCLQDAAAVQSCAGSNDQCFRYLDSLQTLHLGCTSHPDYLTNCNQPRNCRTCATNECNRDDVFSCYTCSDCFSVDKGTTTPIECTIYETDRCYMGYEWQSKVTYRGCASQQLPAFDAADLCYESGCNDGGFPTHLQCYQCVNCNQIGIDDVNYCPSEYATGCYMMLTESEGGGTTLTRGCDTDAQYDECRENQNCVTCFEDNCNGGPPTILLICAQCANVQQCELMPTPYSCRDLTFYNQCYLYSDTDGQLVKGCLLDLEPSSEVWEACYDSADPRCKTCTEISCNQHHCVSCDSRTDGLACILGLLSGALRYEMCSSSKPECVMVIDAEGHTVRGCVDSMADPCLETIDCLTTPLSGSNGDVFPADRRRCFVCGGDELCKSEQDMANAQYCPLYFGATDGCYIFNDETTVVRGCTTDPDARCTTNDDPSCSIGSGSFSNGANQEMMSCYHDCPGGGGMEQIPSCPPSNCIAPNDRCFMSVSNTGIITRGCTTSFIRCPSDSRDCFMCDQPNCNGAYAVCATCDTQEDPDCSVGEEHGDVCDSLSGCFHYENIDRQIYGCADSAPAICTDDMDHCQFCNEPFCNAKALSYCYTCTDCPDVFSPSIQPTILCNTDGDSCFTGLIDSRIDRNCFSNMPLPIESYQPIQNCNERLCNSLSQSSWVSCYVCTGCPDEPSSGTSELCLSPPTDRCYTLRGNDGLVHRGCASDAVFENCVQGLNCNVCSEDDCNDRGTDVGTAESPGFSCVRCEGQQCADYNTISRCPNEKGLLFDGCVTYDDGTTVTKGCLSDEALWALCSAGEPVVGTCTVSQDMNGNARNIRCYTCSEAPECVMQQIAGSLAPLYDHGSCVVLIKEDGTIVRGNSANHGSCTESGTQRCYECAANVCNGAIFPPDRLHCYKCSGSECAQLPVGSSIVPQLCLKYDESKRQCYTRFEGEFYAERGCSTDDEVCQGTEAACQFCDSNECNNADYNSFYETKTCIKCNGNQECETNPTEESCSESRGCYTFFSGLFVVAKGCISEMIPSNSWYQDCALEGGSERCLRCTGDNCNMNRCFVCNSRDGIAEGCLEPRIGVDGSDVCPTQECVAFIDDSGYTVRGCATDYTDVMMDCSGASETCLRCEGDHCNGGPLPKDRLKCFQCTEAEPDCLSPAKGSERYCKIYQQDGAESCYTYFADADNVERGCVAEREQTCEGYCQQCSTAACNSQPALMKNARSCVHCNDEAECSGGNSLVESCPEEVLFGRIDQCYTYFESGVVTKRGCLSQLDENEAASCQNDGDRTCKLCSQNNCNAASVDCIECDSESSLECAGAIMATALVERFRRQCGTGQCVSMVIGGITTKGCAEDFEMECASGTDGVTCQTFDGTLSNSGMYPEDRLQCYKCTGNLNICGQVTTGMTLEPCQHYDPADECYTHVTDTGQTVRGCISDQVAIAECTNNPSHCIRCQADACNTAPGEQTNWLTCAKCTRASECNDPDKGFLFEPCRSTILLGRHDSCYTLSYDGETLARGCLGEADATIRAECPEGGSDDCSVCHCDRCNGPPVKCSVCTGETGCGEEQGAAGRFDDCKTGSCVTFMKRLSGGTSEIVKGCSEDHESETCIVGPPESDATYELCQFSECNDVLYPVGRLRCYQCEGTACSDPLLQPAICDPYIASKDACYSFRDRQQKGCLGQLNEDDLVRCSEEGGMLCEVCFSEDGCNVEPRALECVECTSETDTECVGVGLSGANNMKSCPIGGCATFIDANGFTVKGCAVDYQLTETSCSSDQLCSVCTDGDACNDLLQVPPNRLECFQCSGASCTEMSLQKATVCRRYDPADGCYTYAMDPTNVERGCLSDRDSCPQECVTCTQPNGCNTDPAIVPNELSCYHCDGVDCASATTGQGTACPSSILLGRTDACYSFVETYTVRRGCLSETDACNPSSPNCHVCTDGDDCNGEEYAVAAHECIQCAEMEDGETCKWGYRSTDAVRCQEGLSLGSGCYSCYNTTENGLTPAEESPLGMFLRGCVGDERQGLCHNESLVVCYGAGCNNRNERLQICAKCDFDCDGGRWDVEECRGTVPYERRGCYIMRDSKKRILARGCAAELIETDWQRCTNVKDGTCATCLGNQCNWATTLSGRTAWFLAVITIFLSIFHTLGLSFR